MRLTMLGGGGFRVPLVYGALLGDRGEGRVSDVVLHDLDPARLTAVTRVLAEQAAGVPDAPTVTATTDLDEALRGADFVFSAIRVGGLQGRADDERVALAEGVLGQETVGAGGIAYGLRTVPVAVDIARRVARLAPDAWVINFTNPAGLVTEAMSRHLGDRVIGICDSPVGLGRRVARVLGADPDRAFVDYVGLNHLGWLRGLRVGGRDELPRLLADPALLGSFEEGRLFGAEWRALPRRRPQRVPALLLLQPGDRPRLPGGRPHPGRVPARPAGPLLRRDAPPRRPGPRHLGPHPRRTRGHVHGREPRDGGRGRTRGRGPVRRLREGGAGADARRRP
ncbi:glucosidase [Streptomyces lividans TK24]|nr:glucosidase [Streptomyces lividans TK24]